MPIQGLTNRPPQFPEIGQLRKGGAKPTGNAGPGRDLDHFRFTSDDPRAVEMFKAAHGDTPRQVAVYLPYPTADENFSAWQESWTAAQLNHRCDGEVCYSYNAQGVLVPNGKPCPDIGKPRDDRNRCKQVGRLQVIIPALERFAYVTVLTSSIHDIIALSEQLQALQLLRNGDLRGVPLILRRREEKISMPDGKDKRKRVTKWMLSIEADPIWAALQLQAMQQKALTMAQASTAPQLPAPATEAPADASDLWDDGDDADEGEYDLEPDDDGAAVEPASFTPIEYDPALGDDMDDMESERQQRIDHLLAVWQGCRDRDFQFPAWQRSITLPDKTLDQLEKLITQAEGWLDKLVKAEKPAAAAA